MPHLRRSRLRGMCLAVRRIAVSVLLFGGVPSVGAVSQGPPQALRGIVRDTSGVPVAGADVRLGQLRATTGAEGRFRFDRLAPGRYVVTIRKVGYSSLQSGIAIGASQPTEVAFLLVPSPFVLQPVMVEGRRTGIYGSVADTAYRAAAGTRVQVLGPGGGEMLTDSAGRFAFPEANPGTYMVRVAFAGHGERRFIVHVDRGKGREIAVVLVAASGESSSRDDLALAYLGQRLSFGLAKDGSRRRI